TGLSTVFLEQLYTFGDVDRDPRERVVSVAYYALVNLRDHTVHAATDARDAAWFGVHDAPSLAFDHADILQLALERRRVNLRFQPIGFELLPRKFTLSQLQHLYELVLERDLDKRNFRKRVLAMDLLIETDEVQQDVAHRAARLYRFDERKYRRLAKAGFNFELRGGSHEGTDLRQARLTGCSGNQRNRKTDPEAQRGADQGSRGLNQRLGWVL